MEISSLLLIAIATLGLLTKEQVVREFKALVLTQKEVYGCFLEVRRLGLMKIVTT